MHPSEALAPRDVYGARVVAFVLDLLLVAVAAGPLAGAAGWLSALAFSLVYLGLAQGLTGYSFAKALVGIRVVKAGTVEPPGVVRGLVRWLLGVPELFLTLAIVAGVVSSSNERRRRLGDMAGRTEVVGLDPSPRMRLYAVGGYLLLLTLFIALSSFNTFLIVYAIFVPMVIAGLVLVLGQRRMPRARHWLAGLAFTLVPAAMMSMASLCHRGEGRCGDLAAHHKALPALIALLIAIGILFLARGAIAYAALALLVAAAEVWMFMRVRDVGEMGIAAVLLVVLLVAQVLIEVARVVRHRRAPDEAAAPAPG
ncbi:MAG TPA: RDD family protein [Solirubrobacteraceae bacterium]|nr:RDD family protein [Solirubrobacteraceae bacterium]